MTKNKSKKEIEIELEKTKAELDEIKQMLKLMTNKNEQIAETPKIEQQIDEYVDIPANKYIKVMSLTNHTLVLTTEPFGRGKIYTFTKFGQVRNITYEHVQAIVQNQEKFAKEGKFYIMDKDVVCNVGLESEYENILDKKTLESILDYDNNDIVSIFSNATDAQKQTIVSIIVNRLKNGENLDLNKVEKISQIYEKSLIEMSKPKEKIEEE